MSNLLVVAVIVVAGMFVLYQANASLDFYGSIGFDMFDKESKPFNDKDKEEVDVIIDISNGHGQKIGYPDFEIKAGSESETVKGKEFKDNDGKVRTSIDVDDDTDRVCISAEDVSFKQCKKIDDDEVKFKLVK